ncbi:MAPEG family protein [Tsuneonella dongtanensis]|uniref:MAPEG family protein n=1 Tax=Tsuneonella dongtanensis TaxID=692370 RepID=A0A1B2ADU6_9SPHN|nr:MAPEG family protein [Tsuneonella dongtanensis]ANY20330.1 MAPEG family protein [Tsuneonella dongtanensis]
MILPVTLCAAAAAAIINLWLSMRIGQMRGRTKVSIGDDAGGPLTARMRAQLNFVENTAFVLILIAAIEIAGKGQPWLAWVAAIYMLGRVAHGMGMDGGAFKTGRMIGTLITMLTQLGLAVVAVLVALGVI